MNRLAAYRHLHDLNQHQLGFLLGYGDRGPVAFWETDARRLSLRGAIGYAVIFGFKVEEIAPDVTTEVRQIILERAEMLKQELVLDPDGAKRQLLLLGSIIERVDPVNA